MFKKSVTLRVAASAAVLIAMAACGHKAEADNGANGVATQDSMEVAQAAPETLDSALEEAVDSINAGAKPDSNGYVTTASGLKYKVVRQGTGRTPKATDIVKVDYEGSLTDGTVFDSSYQRGEAIEFPLNRVIPGWTEGLQLMREGAEYIFYIPYQLAYGEQGTPGGPIPPKADLIFKVELLEVK